MRLLAMKVACVAALALVQAGFVAANEFDFNFEGLGFLKTESGNRDKVEFTSDYSFQHEERITMEPDLQPSGYYSGENSQWRLVSDGERKDWEHKFDAETSSEKMVVFFFMKHSPEDLERLERVLYQVSDPKSASYGKHLSLDDLKRLTPVPAENVKTVLRFLNSFGVRGNNIQVNHNLDIIKVHLTPKTAETMFRTKIGLYVHKDLLRTALYRAFSPYSLPESVAKVVQLVGDLMHLPMISTMPKQAFGKGQWENDCPSLHTCEGLVTPGVLRTRYHVPVSTTTAKGNTMSVAEFQGQYFDHEDLKKFSTGCNVNATVDKEIGGDKEIAGIESLLDIEYIKAIAPEIPLTVYYSGMYSLLDWVNKISSDTKPSWVHSVSYGNDERQQISAEYIQSVNTQLMKAGARGLSILFASGDQGVCGREGCGFFSKSFKPDFPAASPYVTAVGGTDFNTDTIGEEKAWSCGGGGFSNHFPLPDFQKEAVEKYKATAKLPPQRFWNATSRGIVPKKITKVPTNINKIQFQNTGGIICESKIANILARRWICFEYTVFTDISALGGQKTPYCVVARGLAVGVAGTSASCPVAAGIFAKLNSIRLSKGKSPLGWLNPFLYQNAQAFQDVTIGNNGCSAFVKGFEATVGWDPATGLGTPNYEKLSKVVAELK